jgi:hypothetical protein
MGANGGNLSPRAQALDMGNCDVGVLGDGEFKQALLFNMAAI